MHKCQMNGVEKKKKNRDVKKNRKQCNIWFYDKKTWKGMYKTGSINSRKIECLQPGIEWEDKAKDNAWGMRDFTVQKKEKKKKKKRIVSCLRAEMTNKNDILVSTIVSGKKKRKRKKRFKQQPSFPSNLQDKPLADRTSPELLTKIYGSYRIGFVFAFPN